MIPASGQAGLSGIKLSEFTDIKETAEKFGKIIDEINYKE